MGFLLAAADWGLVLDHGVSRTGPPTLRAALLVVGVALVWAAAGAAGAGALRALRRRGWPW
ncbi:hypothetical protein rosag_11210 [Roseisolibacter agri]|uniref:Uncharacterized protein n=2 Tax=Roseisolibacter agri TaxID=2014610 RepID=A0AA37QF63_9BACT|nr:hypothetical protein rosag_11210 [Roseisolibacter agri]